MKKQSSLLETRSSSFYMGLAVVVALSSLSVLPVNAAHGGWARCGGGGCRVGWYPSHRSSRRHYGRRGYRYSRSPMDFVQEFLEETPLYLNSLLRQQQEKQNSAMSDDEGEAANDDEQPQNDKQVGESSQFSSSTTSPSASSWFSSMLSPPTPRYEIFESPDGVVEMAMEVPGMSPKALSVEIENDALLQIRGYRSEIIDGNVIDEEPDRETDLLFEKVFELDGSMDVEQIEVFLSRGILTIRIPKKVKVVKHIRIMSSLDDDDEDSHGMIKATVLRSIKKKQQKQNKTSKRKQQIEDSDNDIEITDDDNDENNDSDVNEWQ